MAGLVDFDCEGELVISSLSMNREAFAVIGDENGNGTPFDLIYLFEVRGDDRIVPSATGVIPYPRRITATRHDLNIYVSGEVDENGSPHSNHTEGLAANLAYLRANLLMPIASTDGMRPASYTPPGQAALTGNLHVLGLQRQRQHLGPGALFQGTLQLSIAAGRLT